MKQLSQILFINHKGKQCGVYQYGLRIYQTIQRIDKYKVHYKECSNAQEVTEAIQSNNPHIVIYNFHKETMSFVNKQTTFSNYGPIHICLAHELSDKEINKINGSFFDYYLFGDPTFFGTNDRVFKIRRILPEFANQFEQPQIPTIGTYGFCNDDIKGYSTLLNLVEKEFDQAIVRINLSANSYFDFDGGGAKKLGRELQSSIRNKKIKLEITHDFFSETDLLKFLAKNTINVFMYNPFLTGITGSASYGISSALDYALAVKRPIAISYSSLFRHLFSITPSIIIKNKVLASFKLSIIRAIGLKRFLKALKILSHFPFQKFNRLQDIIKNGFAPLSHLVSEWTEEKFQTDFKIIIDKIYEKEFVTFNRILCNQAREKYQKAIDTLFHYCPNEMARKIYRANVQQAFVFDTVQKLASKNAKILSVGCFEDTAYYSLVKMGYSIEGIDPVTNIDLASFCNLDTTKPASYDLIFSTSVIEHVEDDESFVKQISTLLKPGGYGVLTCDFKNDWRKGQYIFDGNYRFYTQQCLQKRLPSLLESCKLIDAPNWEYKEPDFEHAGEKYTFATFVFQKIA